MTAVAVPLRFQIGARTLAAIPRRLVRVPLSLDAALAGHAPALPPLPNDAHGYLATSMPEDALPGFDAGGLLAFVRQRYTRFFVDLAAGEAAWRAALSGQTRSTLKRKAKKLVLANGGTLDIRAYRSAEEIAAFHPLARAVSIRTYQERLLGAGLPDGASALRRLIAEAGADRVRAWLLFLHGEPVAYLACTADGDTLRYDHVGHDPAAAALSPGSVLMDRALTDLFADRFARFDFTEGEGQHKRAFATGGVACCDLLLLRPTLANRATVAAIGGFDRAMKLGKKWAEIPRLKRIARLLRR